MLEDEGPRARLAGEAGGDARRIGRGAQPGPGQGATFAFTLPLVAAPEEDRPGNAISEPVADGACRVLVADDNADAAAMLALLLQSLGHEVAVARDGVEARGNSRGSSWTKCAPAAGRRSGLLAPDREAARAAREILPPRNGRLSPFPRRFPRMFVGLVLAPMRHVPQQFPVDISVWQRRAQQERRDWASRDALRRRVVGEFDELAGAPLSVEHCRRLLQLRDDVFARVLHELLTMRVLRVTESGQIVRVEGRR